MIKLFLSNAILNYKRALGSFFKVLLGFFFIACLFSCASQSGVTSTSNFPDKAELPQADLNKKIANSAVLTQVDTFEDIYYLGSGDVIELTVFQVEELNTKVRVNGRGEVILPLLGSVNVEDKSISEVEEIVKEKLQADFLQNPQVSIFISEYRSQQITVMGAVKEPNVYSIRQSRSIFEMLSLAGGLTEVASDKIRVKTVQLDSNTR